MGELRRKDWDKMVDMRGMGWERGYYLWVVKEDEYEEVLNIVEKRLKDVVEGSEVRAWNEVEWGWGGSQ